MSKIKFGFTPENENETVLTNLEATYCQKADSCATDSTDIQELNIRTEDAGGGMYFTISTSRWAFDKIEDLISVIRDFENRVNNSK
jgi:hypothetical protein